MWTWLFHAINFAVKSHTIFMHFELLSATLHCIAVEKRKKELCIEKYYYRSFLLFFCYFICKLWTCLLFVAAILMLNNKKETTKIQQKIWYFLLKVSKMHWIEGQKHWSRFKRIILYATSQWLLAFNLICKYTLNWSNKYQRISKVNHLFMSFYWILMKRKFIVKVFFYYFFVSWEFILQSKPRKKR